MAAPNRNAPRIKDSEQNVLNDSFDEEFGVIAVENLGWNSELDAVERIKTTDGAMHITGSITASASTLADFSTNDLDEGATSYFGKTKPDGTWLVQRLTDTSVSYATVTNNGSVTTYTDAWTNKLTLTYGRFDEAF